MITVTPEAAAQIRVSAEQGNAVGLALRIAIERKEDGSFHYTMGFDDQLRPGDLQLESAGVNVVMGSESAPLGKGLMLDYVDLDGKMEFVFMNPNDPHYKPPAEQ